MSSDSQFVQVTVRGMARDPRDNPVVLLKSDEGEDVLPIWIGPAEAMAIEMQLKGSHFERPLTHDLLRTMIENLGATVVKVAITDLREGTFFAKIHLQRGDDVLVVDARPSDSVALALKCNAPILVARDVFSAHKRSLQPDAGSSPGGDDELRRYLKDLDPGEF
ncbi:MAG TPA: bifunctional nuclease family protein [Candidatus Krumholzibacteria bacterium]|nr:bifunctional nuclease family protein [Candidatus Krumholzibacteria bacterium]